MNYYISQVLKEKKITSYLEEQGIFPQKKSGDKLAYRCPIHIGDNDPSLIVYPEGYKGREYQTYYCFGCHSGITIINLKSDFEKISREEAIKYFLKGVKIDDQNIIDSVIKEAEKEKLGIEENHGIEFLLLMINNTCRNFISDDCQMDEEEIAFFEQFFAKVDKVARARDEKTLESIYEILLLGIPKRLQKLKERQEEKEINSLKWKI